jgi:hypothetical protein
MQAILSNMTAIEWAVVCIATAVCLLGAVLPMLGNLLGRLFLGEDPLLARWKQARQVRRADTIAARQAKRENKKAQKAAKKAEKSDAALRTTNAPH